MWKEAGIVFWVPEGFVERVVRRELRVLIWGINGSQETSKGFRNICLAGREGFGGVRYIYNRF